MRVVVAFDNSLLRTTVLGGPLFQMDIGRGDRIYGIIKMVEGSRWKGEGGLVWFCLFIYKEGRFVGY